MLGTLCAQLLIQFCTEHFETLQAFFVMDCACGFGIIAKLIFVTFFRLLNLVILGA